MAAARRPARSQPENRHCFLPMAIERITFFDRVVVDRQTAGVGVTLQRRPALERMVDCLGRAAAGRHSTLVCQEPVV